MAISAVVASLLALGALFMIVGFANNDSSGKGIFLFAVMTVFFVLIAWSNFRALKEHVKEYRQNKDGGLFDELRNINPYKSHEEIRIAYDNERQHPIFQDDDFTITQSFLIGPNEFTIFYIDGILDAKPVVQKVNGVVDYVSLYILYCDGRKYEFKIERTLGFSNMKKEVEKIEFVANTIAHNSNNFRKYPNCKI